MEYITVNEDGLITGRFSGEREGIPNIGEIIQLPDEIEGVQTGLYRDEYDKNWKLRPLKARIKDGTARWVPDHMCLDEEFPEQLRFKTRVELIKEGKEELEEHEKLVGDEIVEKSLEEKLADGLIAQSEYDNIMAERKEADMKAEVMSRLPTWFLKGYNWEQMMQETMQIKESMSE